jgi:hypothetical protein
MDDKAMQRDLLVAVTHFWKTRRRQSKSQIASGRHDAGRRSEVTGGKQLDGFVEIIRSLVLSVGLPERSIHVGRQRSVLPGFFRPTKEWDVVVELNGHLIVTIEFKSQIGPSFGNNFNNRTEEAIGSAHDFWLAYRERRFGSSQRPWLGYLMLLEHCDASSRPVTSDEPVFQVDPAFERSSYARRYAVLCNRLRDERLYDSTCLLLSAAGDSKKVSVVEPDPILAFRPFIASLKGKLVEAASLAG